MLSIAADRADAVTDAVSDAASAVGDVAVELVAMMKRAGAAQRDQMQKRRTKQILKSLQKKYAELVSAKVRLFWWCVEGRYCCVNTLLTQGCSVDQVKRDRAAKAEQLLLEQKEKDREAIAKDLVLQQELKAQMERIAREVELPRNADSNSNGALGERPEDGAMEDSKTRGHTKRQDHSNALDLVGQRQLAEQIQARELALDEAEQVPYLHVPNVRAGVANNHYWQ